MMKRLISLIIPLLLLTGCSSIYENTSGESVSVTDIINSPDGFYMKNKDTLTGLYVPEEMDVTLYDKSLQGEITTFLISKASLNSVPILEGESKIVFKSENDFEGRVFLSPLEDNGYTLGFLLEPEGEGFKIKDHSVALESDAERILDETGLKSERLLSVGSEILGNNHIDMEGFIKGLDEGKLYSTAFLKGTVETKVDIAADTLALKLKPENLEGKVELSYTSEGYALLDLEALPSGYYLVLLPDRLKNLGGIFYVA